MKKIRNIDALAANTAYNKKEILERVSAISVENVKGVIVTKDGDEVISSWKPSKNYEIVDFKHAVKLMLNAVGDIIEPTGYNLTVKRGYQELKIKGNQHIINGEKFHEMIWLTNSTDGTKRLSVRYGIMRQICSNGMVAMHNGASFKVKHLTANNVNEDMKVFMNSLPKLDVSQQIKRFKVLAKKDVTIGHVAHALINEIGEKGSDKIWGLLARKLISSKTDRLGDKHDAAITGINVPFVDMTKETLDIKVPAWNVLNCYTEIWRSLDAGELERETNKIMQILS